MQTTFTTCQSCGGESPSNAQYCIECGESLASAIGPTTKLASPTCPSCGSENPVDGRFCAICGRSMPNANPVGQAWVPSQSLPQARLRPQQAPMPNVQPNRIPVVPPAAIPPSVQPMPPIPPQQSYPRPMPTQQHYHPVRRHGIGPAGIVLIFGMVALFMMKLISWPLFLIVGAAAFLVYQAERGRLNQSLRMVIMAGAGLFVISNPRMWPIMLIAFGIMKLLGGNRRIW